jgi:hypothetical protein
MIDWRRVEIGMRRDQVVEILGQPDDVGGSSRKYRTPSVFKYGHVEFHFESNKHGRLIRVYTEDADGNGTTLLGR